MKKKITNKWHWLSVYIWTLHITRANRYITHFALIEFEWIYHDISHSVRVIFLFGSHMSVCSHNPLEQTYFLSIKSNNKYIKWRGRKTNQPTKKKKSQKWQLLSLDNNDILFSVFALHFGIYLLEVNTAIDVAVDNPISLGFVWRPIPNDLRLS